MPEGVNEVAMSKGERERRGGGSTIIVTCLGRGKGVILFQLILF
jgi:hypothetical protein